jgi:predicted RNA-binding Zn-ribbon protein involved in translation (DUF1610 family)
MPPITTTGRQVEMYARECQGCGWHWPHDNEFRDCPQCGKMTRVSTVARAMSGEQAKRTVRAIEFERYCGRRDQEREARGEPSPEDLGRLDAERDLAEVRRLESLL